MALSTEDHFVQSTITQKILAPVTDAAVGEPIESMVLVGSMARGELTIRSLRDTLDLWSDVDLYIVASAGAKVNESRLRAKYAQISNDLDMPNPFFHIDFSVLDAKRLHLLSKRISTFEARENGMILVGRDVRSDMPVVSPRTLDFGNTRQLILIRLTEMLFYTPSRLVLHSSSWYERLIFRYVQARNALDILTVLLPHEGVLLPSYKARNQYLQSNYEQLAARVYMGSRFAVFQEEALQGKLSLQFTGDLVQFYEETLIGFRNLLRYLLSRDETGVSSDIFENLKKTDVDFNNADRPIRQHINDLKLAARSRVLNKPALHPANNKKMILAFLLWIHSALLAHLQGSADAVTLLQSAREALSAMSRKSMPCSENDFAEDWLALRHRFLDIYTSLYPAKQTRRAYYSNVIERRYDSTE